MAAFGTEMSRLKNHVWSVGERSLFFFWVNRVAIDFLGVLFFKLRGNKYG